MLGNKVEGYLWIALGIFLVIWLGGRLVLQLLSLFVGFSLIVKGLRILAMDRALYNYSKHYFEDNFRM